MQKRVSKRTPPRLRLGEHVAEAKLAWLDKQRRWFKALAEAAHERIYAALAKVEMEKAKLAAAKTIKPTKDFNLNTYTNEFAKRQKDVDEAHKLSDKRKAEMEKAALAYYGLKSQLEQSKKPASPPPASTGPTAAK